MPSRRSPPSRGRGSKHVRGANRIDSDLSPPSRGRGSKQQLAGETQCGFHVAPLTGAWIETNHHRRRRWRRQSPPSRGRGSKRCQPTIYDARPCRPPHGGVDRNARRLFCRRKIRRRPPHGGVDRNRPCIVSYIAIRSRPPHGGVDRNRSACLYGQVATRRPPHGGVDRNIEAQIVSRIIHGRPPHGGVDRNSERHARGANRINVAPLTGAWIETSWSVSF